MRKKDTNVCIKISDAKAIVRRVHFIWRHNACTATHLEAPPRRIVYVPCYCKLVKVAEATVNKPETICQRHRMANPFHSTFMRRCLLFISPNRCWEIMIAYIDDSTRDLAFYPTVQLSSRQACERNLRHYALPTKRMCIHIIVTQNNSVKLLLHFKLMVTWAPVGTTV